MTTGSLKPTAEDRFYLPDLCAPAAVLGVVLIAELTAITLTLARQPAWDMFFPDLAKTSLLMLWLSLTAAAILCALRRRLAHFPLGQASLLTALAVLAVVWIVSEGVYWLGLWYGAELAGVGGWFPARRGFFVSRNLVLGALLTGGLLRYFYVTHEWRRNVEQQAASRIHALQARIRPHFLFNSMNTIAELTRQDPAAAEAAVEDLSDLFRASLSDAKEMVRLDEEMDITRVYVRMERQRLGERLKIEWATEQLPGDARIPGLTLQPLLENAINHGVEPLPEPGAIEVAGLRKGDMLYLSVRNPLPVRELRKEPGNRIAVDNIRERLVLAFGPRAALSTAIDATHYQVSLAFPYRP
ncbi:MAG: sensor histidine kinase [Gammaproteobacteria bacterium]